MRLADSAGVVHSRMQYREEQATEPVWALGQSLPIHVPRGPVTKSGCPLFFGPARSTDAVVTCLECLAAREDM